MPKMDLTGVGNEQNDGEAVKIKKMADQAGIPVLKAPEKKEPQRQVNIGALPLSLKQAIDDHAYKKGMTRRTLILTLLKQDGVPVPTDLLRDRRTTEE